MCIRDRVWETPLIPKHQPVALTLRGNLHSDLVSVFRRPLHIPVIRPVGCSNCPPSWDAFPDPDAVNTVDDLDRITSYWLKTSAQELVALFQLPDPQDYT
eukprot:9183362-Pyramimonas_sp.AAC.1